MAEPDRTNADAERVSDIVARLRADADICAASISETINQVGRNCEAAADIIEAQSKALAEARELVDATFDLRFLVSKAAEVSMVMGVMEAIADMAEGSTTANSLPHIAKLAREALSAHPIVASGAGNSTTSEEQIRRWEAEREALTAKIDDASQHLYDEAIASGESVGADYLGEKAR